MGWQGWVGGVTCTHPRAHSIFTLLCRCVGCSAPGTSTPVQVSPLVSPVSPVPGRPSYVASHPAAPCGHLCVGGCPVRGGVLAASWPLTVGTSCTPLPVVTTQKPRLQWLNVLWGPHLHLRWEPAIMGLFGFHRNIKTVPVPAFTQRLCFSCNHPSVAG